MNIQKRGEGFELSSPGGTYMLTRQAFEDLFYAIPLNSTALYRLLTDQIPGSDSERERMVKVLGGCPDMDADLMDLQKQIGSFRLD